MLDNIRGGENSLTLKHCCVKVVQLTYLFVLSYITLTFFVIILFFTIIGALVK